MFARTGMRPPALVGSSTPAQVASVVQDAIRRNRREVIVNSLPMRPAIALAELFPSIGDWLQRRLGVVAFHREKAATHPPQHAA